MSCLDMNFYLDVLPLLYLNWEVLIIIAMKRLALRTTTQLQRTSLFYVSCLGSLVEKWVE
jgi:hypothetical protein